MGFRDAEGPLHAWDEAGESREGICTILSQRAAVRIKSVLLKVFITEGKSHYTCLTTPLFPFIGSCRRPVESLMYCRAAYLHHVWIVVKDRMSLVLIEKKPSLVIVSPHCFFFMLVCLFVLGRWDLQNMISLHMMFITLAELCSELKPTFSTNTLFCS